MKMRRRRGARHIHNLDPYFYRGSGQLWFVDPDRLSRVLADLDLASIERRIIAWSTRYDAREMVAVTPNGNWPGLDHFYQKVHKNMWQIFQYRPSCPHPRDLTWKPANPAFADWLKSLSPAQGTTP